MTIARIRYSMQFEESYHVASRNLEIRIYATKRPGAYGYQFAAIAWIDGTGYASGKTTGCGYDKKSTAVAEALYAACLESGGNKYGRAGKAEKILRYAGTGQIAECIATFLDVENMDDWRAFSEWRNANLYHAHG